MALDDELKAQILRYHFVEHWRVPGAIDRAGVPLRLQPPVQLHEIRL